MIHLFEDAAATGRIGKELGISRWLHIDQQRISDFGRITEDPDPAHIDEAWAAEHSPFGCTIAFGFLTMSLMTTMVNEIVARPADEVSTLNYGFDRLRLLAPVRVNQRVRGRLVLRDLAMRTPTQFRVVYGVTIEIEGEERPALVGDWIIATNVQHPRVLLKRA